MQVEQRHRDAVKRWYDKTSADLAPKELAELAEVFAGHEKVIRRACADELINRAGVLRTKDGRRKAEWSEQDAVMVANELDRQASLVARFEAYIKGGDA